MFGLGLTPDQEAHDDLWEKGLDSPLSKVGVRVKG